VPRTESTVGTGVGHIGARESHDTTRAAPSAPREARDASRAASRKSASPRFPTSTAQPDSAGGLVYGIRGLEKCVVGLCVYSIN
jgi:hypothetical protein